MKIIAIFFVTFYLLVGQLLAMEPRSEMMVRYYEGKPIVEKRSALALEHSFVKFNETDWVKLDSNGLHASPDILILDTFSLTYNPTQSYLMLKTQELTFPSEHLLLVRKANQVYILDLDKEIVIGQFSIEMHMDSYISLKEDDFGQTSLHVQTREEMKQSIVLTYQNGVYLSE